MGARKIRTVELRFDPKQFRKMHKKDVRDGLSVAAATGKFLWLASDEGACLERVTEVAPGVYGQHQAFRLSEYIALPSGKDEEIDIEGMSVGQGYLWIAGSHSLQRKKPGKGAWNASVQLRRLLEIKKEPNRYFIARIPLDEDVQSGEVRLSQNVGNRRAAVLDGDKRGNELMRVLKNDPHLAPFLTVPGKDNGFDIEGLAVHGNSLYLGLRGPVLRGWAVVLRVEIAEAKGKSKSVLKLKNLRGNGNKKYEKHFVYCGGLGVRELAVDGNDLLILAGPTMVLDGDIVLFRWKQATKLRKDSITRKDTLIRVAEIPHGTGKHHGKDRAEGLALLSSNGSRRKKLRALVAYDNPVPSRKRGQNVYLADVFDVVA